MSALNIAVKEDKLTHFPKITTAQNFLYIKSTLTKTKFKYLYFQHSQPISALNSPPTRQAYRYTCLCHQLFIIRQISINFEWES